MFKFFTLSSRLLVQRNMSLFAVFVKKYCYTRYFTHLNDFLTDTAEYSLNLNIDLYREISTYGFSIIKIMN